jgi:hypothetical protein
MEGACILHPTYGQFFIYTQSLPLLIGAAFTGLTAVTGSLFFAFLGGYLFVMGYFVWPFQAYINQTRNPLLCPLGASQYAFPAIEMLYVMAIVTMVLYYTIFFHGRPGYWTWFSLFLLLAVPAGVLVFFQFNVWYEVLMSAGVSLVLTTMFMIHMQLFIAPSIPYLEVVPPFSSFYYSDDLAYGYNPHSYPDFQKARRRVHQEANYKGERWRVKMD